MRIRTVLVVLAAVAVAATGCTSSSGKQAHPSTSPSADTLTGFKRSEASDQTTVTGPDGKAVATLTRGARTVVFAGHERVFKETANTPATITTTAWVRVAPQPWQPGEWGTDWFREWFPQQIGSQSPDVFGAAMEYLVTEPDAAKFALNRDGDTVDGADFNDYLGQDWTFPGGKVVRADPKWLRGLDCSGYLRLVYGYRMGVTLYPSGVTGPVDGLPRTARLIATNSKHVDVAVPDQPDQRPANLDRIQPGDLVFFALHTETGISHSGIYLGKDNDGRMRFVSSRGTAGGPTFSDIKGASVIDPGTYFGDRLRRVIRL